MCILVPSLYHMSARCCLCCEQFFEPLGAAPCHVCVSLATYGDSSPCPLASRTHWRTSPHRYRHGIPSLGQGQSRTLLTLYSGTRCGLSARRLNGYSLVNTIKSPYASTGGRHTPCGSAIPIAPASRPRGTTVPPIPRYNTRRNWQHGIWRSPSSNDAAMF